MLRNALLRVCSGPESIKNCEEKKRKLLPLIKMSDYDDDEMDLDAPAKASVVFSSNNTDSKGKRSAANLPVEAEDSLPW